MDIKTTTDTTDVWKNWEDWRNQPPKYDEKEEQCLHRSCPKCHGTGRSEFGACIHMISCRCKKCTPYYCG